MKLVIRFNSTVLALATSQIQQMINISDTWHIYMLPPQPSFIQCSVSKTMDNPIKKVIVMLVSPIL